MRRTQVERTEATTAGLVAAAAEIFGRDGYAAASIDDIARSAGVTKGAVYHHFAGKADLFRAALVREEHLLAERLTRAAAAAAAPTARPWALVRAGCMAFLEACLEPAVRRIILLDGPSVLGWAEVRAIEDGLVIAKLRAAVARASAPEDVDARTHLLLGALCEAGMLLARDPTTLPSLSRAVGALVDAYAAG